MTSFAIVGAGVAGLSCGSRLRALGHDVRLFDAAKSAGGRMASVWVEIGEADICLDVGASHFTVRSDPFREVVTAWQESGLANRWPPAGADSWVGTPSMSAPIEEIASRLDVCWGSEITHLSRSSGKWIIHSGKDSYGPFDAVLAATPAGAVARLFVRHDRGLADRALKQDTHPIWTASFVFGERLENQPDFERLDGAITYVARQASKPERADAEALTVQASWQWSARHIDAPASEVASRLLDALSDATGRTMPRALYSQARCWYAGQPDGSDLGPYWNSDTGVGACGDWLSRGHVEHAWTSGYALANEVAGR